MRSRRGFLAAAIFLLALPVALLCQLLLGRGAEPAMHFLLALGAGSLIAALTDFPAPKLATALGRLSLGALGAILAQRGTAIPATLKLLYLAPFVWLLIESRKQP